MDSYSVSETTSPAELRRRLLWYVNLRWVFILALAASGIIPEFLGHAGYRVIHDLELLGAALALNGIFLILSSQISRSRRYYQLAGAAQILFDIFIASTTIFTHGGIESRTVILYAIPILVTGAIFTRRATYITGSVAAAAYATIISLDYFRIIPTEGVLTPMLHYDQGFFLTSVIFYPASLLILSVISSFIISLFKFEQEEAAKSELISMASHQLRTPATAVKGFLSMLQDGIFGDLTIEQLRNLQQAYRENEYQLEVIDALLNVAKIDAPSLSISASRFDLNEVITEIMAEQAIFIKARDQHTKTTLHPEKITVTADRELIKILITNLVNNASKYTPPGGEIHVKATIASGQLVIAVKDNGAGIAENDLRKLFQKFSRLHNTADSPHGAGLGLYMAQRIAALHHGRIDVESERDQGTTFTLILPHRD